GDLRAAIGARSALSVVPVLALEFRWPAFEDRRQMQGPLSRRAPGPPAQASRLDTRPSDSTSGSVANPVFAGGGASLGQRKLTGRSGGNGFVLVSVTLFS